jgi:predicted transposase YbfD/YdcC
MSYAKALQKKTCVASEQTRVYAYAHAVHALWGDIEQYHPAVDGDYKTFFNASAERKRKLASKDTLTPQQVEEDQERLREKALAREQRQKQAKAKELLREWTRIKVRAIRARVAIRAKSFNRKACKCGCGRLVHSNPTTDMDDFCCRWCAKHGGRRGHGESCEAISSTTFLRLA